MEACLFTLTTSRLSPPENVWMLWEDALVGLRLCYYFGKEEVNFLALKRRGGWLAEPAFLEYDIIVLSEIR